ncbi:UNVERIFIED_CONTAM: hypothetical protein PYX00_009765 [Menopon gallinae]|uniref:Uncharacterized protein n=1 Tax=Menopon gallinae TaxID=328185 RepID=A0AAW2HDA6_9NEOP
MVALAAADAPPIPYAAASSGSYPAATYSHDELQTYGGEGFNIQSGFEGYLVPSSSQKGTVLLPISHGLEYLSSPGGLARLVKAISVKGLRLIPKIVLGVVAVAGLFLAGCLITTAVCTFTPFCTISFLGWGVARESMRSFLTEDRISATAAFVTEAIRKYQELYGRDQKTDENKTKQ